MKIIVTCDEQTGNEILGFLNKLEPNNEGSHLKIEKEDGK